MAVTPNLILPYILAAQAQKHVTHNEAVRMLDALVQLAVADRSLSAPPASPADGARYIVAASPTGAWSGHATHIAAYQDGAWMFYPPQAGWLAWVADELVLVAWDGSAWVLASSAGGGIANVVEDTTPQLGGQLDVNGFALGDGTLELVKFSETASAVNEVTIANAATGNGPTISATGEDTNVHLNLAGKGTGAVRAGLLAINGATADTTNRLAMTAPASLFNHAGAGHQAKINKNAAGDTASFLFQTGFSGRAEMGTTGDDDFHFKVSPDGSAWFEALKIDRSNGRVSFPSGGVRERLTANRTYYVRTDGSDSNTGLVDSAAGAFLMIQKAINVVYGTLDLAGFTATIQVRSGTYTSAVLLTAPQVGSGTVLLTGDTTTPSNVVMSVASNDALSLSGPGINLSVAGIKFVTTTGGSGIRSENGAYANITGKCEFGACATFQMIATGNGIININGPAIIISGNSNAHYFCSAGGIIISFGIAWTLTGTPAFGIAFAVVQGGQINSISNTVASGTATGSRYSATLNGVINTNGGSASYFPGNSAGSTATGGQYA